MPDFESYERHSRDGEEWHLRGRLRMLYLSGRLRPLEEIISRAKLKQESKRRMILLASLDERPYELRVYEQGSFLRRSKALEQLTFATRAVGAGIEITPLDAACVAGGHIVIFLEDPEDWIDPAVYLASPKVRPKAKELFLDQIARFCRRLHDSGFYQQGFSLSSIRARVLPHRMEFRLHDLDQAEVRDIDDGERLEMLGKAWQQAPVSPKLAMRFLRAYLKEGEDAHKVGLILWHYYGRKIARKPAPERSGQGRFALDTYEVLYQSDETSPGELKDLYKAGLKDPDLRIVRSPDALTLWKRALKEAEPESVPLACFIRKKQTGGFVLYRELENAEEASEPS